MFQENSKIMKRQATIIQKENQVYILVNNEWYMYNLAEPPLGTGAMGTVYLGRSCNNPSFKVAIKRVADQYIHIQSIRERAKLEASLLFRHSHLVEMVGFCEYAPGYGPIFIVSHLVQGITLDKYVQENLRKRADATIRICRSMFPVLDALEYLHSKGIVHLDVKPSNVMVENGCNIRLMDLGIAYTSEILDNVHSKGMIGTPQYAAPEQCAEEQWNGARIDATTDIYEAGVTLYELLAEYNPFDAPTVSEIVNRHYQEELPYVQGISKELVDVLRKATAKRQVDRFQTCGEFKRALLRVLTTKPKSWWQNLLRI